MNLIEIFPELNVDCATDFLLMLIIILSYLTIISFVFFLIIFYFLPYSSVLQFLFLNMLAKQRAAYHATQNTQLVEMQKKLILEKKVSLFPCFDKKNN